MAVATRTFFDMMADRRTVTAMLFGDACYNVTGPIVQIAHQWRMFQLSYADTNPMLSDRDEFPNFYRTVPSDSDFNPARLAILRHFNWSTVGTLIHAKLGGDRHAFAHNRFVTLMGKNKINISVMESFTDDPEPAVKILKTHDVRIIVGNFDQVVARRVFCSARHHKLFGPKYQWIVLGTYDLDWWMKEQDDDVPCSPQELNDTLHGYLATDVLPLSTNDEVTESGKTPSEYRALYDEERGSEYSKYHGYAYDGVWVMAKAVDRLLDGLTMTTHVFRGPMVGKILNDTSFLGVTGRVQFMNGDRMGSTKLLQMQYGQMVKVGEYHAISDHLDLRNGQPILWRSTNPPVDRSFKVEELRHVSSPVYIGVVVMAAIGITMAVLFLALNIHFRRHSYIKMSSPNMNNLIIVGCILCYLSLIPLGAEPDKKADEDVYKYLCTARSWSLALGFTLAFGAMFGKTWRVHAIFTNVKLNRKVIKDYKLMLIVLVLVLLDAVILVTWQIVDPIQKATKRLSPEIYGDFEIIPMINYCTSEYMEIWLGALYAYKGLLLAFGCFLAWETRQVSIPALNDSKYIGMSVYNVVIMCVCGAALSFIIQDKPTTSFIIIGLFIIFCTTITLCLVFLPKIIQLKRNPSGDESRVRATLRKTTRKTTKLESTQQKERIRAAAEENRRLRSDLERRVAELEHVVHQFGDDKTIEEAKTITSAALLHNQLHDFNYHHSPARLSIKSYNGGEMDTASMYSEVSAATTTMFITEDSPVHQRMVKANRLHGNRMGSEAIEMAGVRYGHRKSSVTLPPAAEEEEDEVSTEIGSTARKPKGNTWRTKLSGVWGEKRVKLLAAKETGGSSRTPSFAEVVSSVTDDPFGGVYLGPDESSTADSKEEEVVPKKGDSRREKEPLITNAAITHHTTLTSDGVKSENSNGTNVLMTSFGSLDTNTGLLTRSSTDNSVALSPSLHAARVPRIDASFHEVSASDDIVLL